MLHTLIEQLYPTGHTGKSSLTLFHETPILENIVAQLIKLVSQNWLVGGVVVGVGSNPDRTQLVLLYFSTIIMRQQRESRFFKGSFVILEVPVRI